MGLNKLRGAIVAAIVVAMPACKPAGSSGGGAEGPGVTNDARVPAGGVLPAANALSAPRPSSPDPKAGEGLFASMNCDGCHGGGAVGWVGPSLTDGRWRYGGSDDEIFYSIFYGRPKGMPAYGGVIGVDGVWMIVAYLKAQPVAAVVPTTSWGTGGTAEPAPASAAPATPAPATPAAEVAVSPDQVPAKYGCVGCHAVDKKVVGPSFKDVAAKYQGKDVKAELIAKIKNGGAGVWGQIPMPPNPSVPDKDLDAVVTWILSLK
jgi:cytochrome c